MNTITYLFWVKACFFLFLMAHLAGVILFRIKSKGVLCLIIKQIAS